MKKVFYSAIATLLLFTEISFARLGGENFQIHSIGPEEQTVSCVIKNSIQDSSSKGFLKTIDGAIVPGYHTNLNPLSGEPVAPQYWKTYTFEYLNQNNERKSGTLLVGGYTLDNYTNTVGSSIKLPFEITGVILGYAERALIKTATGNIKTAFDIEDYFEDLYDNDGPNVLLHVFDFLGDSTSTVAVGAVGIPEAAIVQTGVKNAAEMYFEKQKDCSNIIH